MSIVANISFDVTSFMVGGLVGAFHHAFKYVEVQQHQWSPNNSWNIQG